MFHKQNKEIILISGKLNAVTGYEFGVVNDSLWASMKLKYVDINSSI